MIFFIIASISDLKEVLFALILALILARLFLVTKGSVRYYSLSVAFYISCFLILLLFLPLLFHLFSNFDGDLGPFFSLTELILTLTP